MVYLGWLKPLYRLVCGEMDPYKPNKSFTCHRRILHAFGIWQPDTKNKIIIYLFIIYGLIFQGFFLHIYVLSEILFFFHVEDVNAVSEALFFLLTQFSLSIKMMNFMVRYKRIRTLYDRHESELFRPKTKQEEEYVKEAMLQTFFGFFIYILLSSSTVTAWALFPLVDDGERRLPLAVWYPFDTTTDTAYWCAYFYQIIATYISAMYNPSCDTFYTGLMAHLNAQVLRLGDQIAAVGHPTIFKYRNSEGELVTEVDKESSTSQRNQLAEKMYKDYYECILFHKILISYTEEVEDIIRDSIFMQTLASTLIICMTAYQMVLIPVASVHFCSLAIYLTCMITEIWLPCWMGNELIYSSTDLKQKAFFSNIAALDRRSGNLLKQFMIRCNNRIEVKAGSLIKVTLSLENFLGLMKTSYSYFALMRSMQ